MAEFKFYICDDSAEFCEAVKKRITEVLSGTAVCDTVTVNDGEELVKLYRKEMPDAVFLDIDMPNINGFEAAKELQKQNENICIVFITSFEDKVYESWNYNPFWFVRKSHIADLDNVLHKLVKRLRAKRLESSSVRLNGENRVYELEVRDIVSLESEGHYILVQSKKQSGIRIRSRISDMEEQLKGFGFVRVNRGVIVNLREISSVSAKALVLHNGMIYSIGKDRTADIKESFLKFTRGGNI